MESYCLVGVELPFGKMKKVLVVDGGDTQYMHDNVNVCMPLNT